jgi:hypothetical protein
MRARARGNGGEAMAQDVCIVGGGASGVALMWCLAKAQQQNSSKYQYNITLLHDAPGVTSNEGVKGLGGHSLTYEADVDGQSYFIDLGVQMIAPAMYPNLMAMLKLPQFARTITLDPVPLKISCAFPPQGGGSGPAMFWGNYPDYQSTSLYKAGQADASLFQQMLAAQPGLPIALQPYLAAQQHLFNDFALFETYFLDPYLSIMNGYGAALLDEVYIPEIGLLFDRGYASFTNWSSDFMRFHDGAMAWVQAMANDAIASVPANTIQVVTGANVTAVTPGSPKATVTYTIDGSSTGPVAFDAVVLTTDMATNGDLLLQSGNPLKNFYAEYVGQDVWGLVPGYCYLHQDPSILAPGTIGTETLQFTAYWSRGQQPFDLVQSWTTYIYKNLMGVGDPKFDYYLTMYGFDPQGTGLPIPKNPIFPTPMNWTHGMWLPSFMWQQKALFRTAQSTSPHYRPLPGQQQTNVFFAGNNLTMDSEEGALVSAMALASYAFDVDALNLVLGGTGWFNRQAMVAALFYFGMFNLMFPGLDVELGAFTKALGIA